MYNNDQKVRFLNSISTDINDKSRLRMSWFLERMSKYETELSKDLADFSIEEIKNALCDTGFQVQSIQQSKRWLSSYIRFVRDDVEASSAIIELEPDLSTKIRSQMVVDDEDLLQLMNSLLPVRRPDDRNLIFRVFLWMAYNGIDVFDAVHIVERDVNYDTGMICFGGDVYRICSLCVDDIKALCSTSSITDIWSNGKERTISRVAGSTILRGTSEKGGSEQQLRAILSKKMSILRAEFGRQLSYEKVYLSGIFARAPTEHNEEYFRNIILGEIRRRRYVEKERSGKNYFIPNKAINRRVRNYISNYQMWKEAFRSVRT